MGTPRAGYRLVGTVPDRGATKPRRVPTNPLSQTYVIKLPHIGNGISNNNRRSRRGVHVHFQNSALLQFYPCTQACDKSKLHYSREDGKRFKQESNNYGGYLLQPVMQWRRDQVMWRTHWEEKHKRAKHREASHRHLQPQPHTAQKYINKKSPNSSTSCKPSTISTPITVSTPNSFSTFSTPIIPRTHIVPSTPHYSWHVQYTQYAQDMYFSQCAHYS